MREYLCRCMKCGNEQNKRLNEPYPKYGDIFCCFCKLCQEETEFTRALTKKVKAEINVQAAEDALLERINRRCSLYGFKTRRLYLSIVIQTPKSEWSFDYHEKLKTLIHESTYKFNLKTGKPAKAHIQFQKRNMTIEEVIDYIARHDHIEKKEV